MASTSELRNKLSDTLRELAQRDTSSPRPPLTEVLGSVEISIGVGNTLVDTQEDLSDNSVALSAPEMSETFGRYELVAELGRGGRGRVMRARDPELQRHVAIKMLLDHRYSRRELGRFLAEAQVTAQLEHPSIVPVHDIGLTETGVLFYVMKELRGYSLAHLLERLRAGDESLREQWSEAALLRAFVRVCEAVDYAHSRGVLHRDLKPSNIVLGSFGAVYVVDWGVARIQKLALDDAPEVEELDVGETSYGTILGTPGYISPEQTRGASLELDGRSDVWSLGALLYELLTLERFVPGDSVAKLLHATLDADGLNQRVEAASAHLPAALAQPCAQALASELDERLPSAHALAEQVQRYLTSIRRREEDVASWLAAHIATTATSIEARVARIHDALRSLERATHMCLCAEAPSAQVDAWVAEMRMGYDSVQHFYSRHVSETVLTGGDDSGLQTWYSGIDLSSDHAAELAQMYRMRHLADAMQDVMIHHGVSFVYFSSAQGFVVARPCMPFGEDTPLLPPAFDFRNYTAYRVAEPTANPTRQVQVTPPHVDYNENGLITAFARPCYDHAGEFLGVWAMDVLLSALYRDANLAAGADKTVFIVDLEGALIAHPAHEAYSKQAQETEVRHRWTEADPRLAEFDPRALFDSGSGWRELSDAEGGKTLLCYHAVPTVSWLVCALGALSRA